MISVNPLGKGGPDYYLAKVAMGVEDYYLGRGEPPGRWTGKGTPEFDLAGQVLAHHFKAAMAGIDPVTGEELAAPNRTVPGFDLCFKAPKSASLLYGLGDPGIAGAVVAAHEDALDAALEWFESEAAWARRGRNGVERVATSGFIAAAFRHRTSRAGDPHLHTHVVAANLVKRSDGKWGTLDSKTLHYVSLTAGYLYQAHLRAGLADLLGVEWEPVVNGYADIAGFDRDVIEHFSQRHGEVVEFMADRGETSARAGDIAALVTRKTKDYAVDPNTLRAGWRQRAEALGFDGHALHATLHRVDGSAPPDEHDRELLARLLSSPEGLTETASTFTAHEVIRAYAQAAGQGAPVKDVLAWAGDYLARPELRHLPASSWKTKAAFHTTADMLALERRCLRTVADRQGAGVGLVPDDLVAQAVARRPSLTLEQVKLVEALTTTGAGIQAVIAPAGTGKTFTLDTAREAWQAAGRRVIGCALSAQAAAELQAGAGITSSTIALLLQDLDGEHTDGLPKGSVLVVDEAGIVGTRTLARLLDHAHTADAKVVLVGDPKQLPEIEAGGLIRGIESRFGVLTLHHNRRQRHAWERAALRELRDGDVSAALAAYDAEGRIVRADSAAEVREAMAGHWWAATQAGEDAVMLAPRRSDVDDLNARARARLAFAGRLHGPELVAYQRPYQAGDHVLCLRNNYRLGVLNGTRGTVTDVDETKETLTLDVGQGKTVTLPRWYIQRGHVTHGYALTIHKAQGMTVDRALVLGSDALYREMGYTAMSRGRDANHLYVVGGKEPDLDATHPAPEPPEPDEVVFAALERSGAKALAVEALQAPLTGRLAALHAERRRLAPVIDGCPPDPEAERYGLTEARESAVQRLQDAEAVLADTKRPLLRRTTPQLAWAAARADDARRTLADLDASIAGLDQRAAERADYLDTHREHFDRAGAVDRAIDATLNARLDEVEGCPPRYLTDTIGTRPDGPNARRAWRSAAAVIETHRAAAQVSDDGTALGPAPDDDTRHIDWLVATQDLDLARHSLQTMTRLDRLAIEQPDTPELEYGLEL